MEDQNFTTEFGVWSDEARPATAALRQVLKQQLPAQPASDRLRATVRAALRAEAQPRRARFAPVWRSLAAAAVLVIVAGGTWTVATSRARTQALTDEVLASHVRALIGTHLVDVASTDQHTVKPWFNGKLDFSPPVNDFAAQGYPLLGGRIDYIAGRPVATLVYGRRKHVINVFVWPAERGPTSGPASRTRQGYHMLHWTTADYTYWVVSDLARAELEPFAGLVSGASRQPR